MTLDPLLSASLAVQIHVATVVPAFVMGGLMLMARKGTRVHKILGRVWIALMVITALSSFFIHEIRLIGGFSPIHLLSVVTLVSCIIIVVTARRRRFTAHRRTVLSLYWGGIGLAGAFTIIPGRIMNEVIFDGSTHVWPVVAGAVLACTGILLFTRRDKSPSIRTSAASVAAILVLSALVLLDASGDAHAAPGAADIAARTPLWVWPLLAALLFMGWLQSRDRIVAKARLLIPPMVFAGIGAVSLALNGPSLVAATALILALITGGLLGKMLGRRNRAIILSDGKVQVRGEWVSMGLILVIFASRFVAGAAQGIDPSLAGTATIAVPMAILSGFTVGLTGMRALVQTGIRS